jgi:hypothetical protein
VGKGGRYHADPLFAKYGILKVGDLLYGQQLRIHAWKFHNGRLPDSQAAILARVAEFHSYGTRAACSGLVMRTGDRRLVGYRIPTEWGTLTEAQRAIMSIAGFKQSSKGDFLVHYGAFQCGVVGCLVCGR